MCLMAEPPTPLARSWKSTYALVCVIVDARQVANEDVSLVIKRQAAQSPAMFPHSLDRSAGIRHTLMVFTANETKPTVELSLDGFLLPMRTSQGQARMRYSVKTCRLIIEGSPLSTSTPIHDLRFKGRRDLLDAIAKLESIGIVCEPDDPPAHRPHSSTDIRSPTICPSDSSSAPGSRASFGSRKETTSPFVISPQSLKSRRVVSPLDRRPDGSMPAFGLKRLPKNRSTTPTLPPPSAQHAQETPIAHFLRDQQYPMSVPNSGQATADPGRTGSFWPELSHDRGQMPPPKRHLDFTFKSRLESVESETRETTAHGPSQEPTSSLALHESLQLFSPGRQLNATSDSNSGQSGFFPRRRRRPLQELPPASQQSQSSFPPRRDLDFASQPCAVHLAATRKRSGSPVSLQDSPSSQLSQNNLLSPSAPNGSRRPRQRLTLSADVDTSSSRPAKRRKPPQPDIPQHGSQGYLGVIGESGNQKLSNSQRVGQLGNPGDLLSGDRNWPPLDIAAEHGTTLSRPATRPADSLMCEGERSRAGETPSPLPRWPNSQQCQPMHTKATQAPVDECSQPAEILQPSRPKPVYQVSGSGPGVVYREAGVQTDSHGELDAVQRNNDRELDAVVGEDARRRRIQLVYMKLDKEFFMRVEAAPDNDQEALNRIVDDFQKKLTEQIRGLRNSLV